MTNTKEIQRKYGIGKQERKEAPMPDLPAPELAVEVKMYKICYTDLIRQGGSVFSQPAVIEGTGPSAT